MRIDAARKDVGRKKNFPIPRMKFRNSRRWGEEYALYRNKRNPMGGSAKYISHRSCSRQSLSYRDRSIFDGANTAVHPSIYNIKRGQNLTRLCYGLSFMFLNHSILTMERLREIEGKEKEGRRISFRWINSSNRGCM